MSLAEINKALDALDPNRLDEKGVESWALAKIAQASQIEPKHRGAFLDHTRKQVSDAQAAFTKGDAKFTITEFVPPSASGVASASSKLAKALADLAEANKTEDGATEGAESEEASVGDADADKGKDSEAAESESDAEGTAKGAKKKPARKAAPNDVGVEKGFHTVESDDDVWGDSLSASMSKIKLGSDGQLYVRD